jgi:predicted site-specific integrase-resolvase|tara:strand:- start:1471 stop:1677 length:207 start_codon:yes stop_codon:yes gene_type:complete
MNFFNKNENLLSRTEASQFFKVSLPTLWRWTNKGLIKPYYLGGRVYYKYDELINSLLTKGGSDECPRK